MTTINRKITTRAEVDALTTEPESETLDYKGDVDASEWWELAKDLAAFANHLGGVLVIGAHENKSNGLPFMKGIEPKRARELAQAYENIARDRCRPSPLVMCERITLDGGREILTVNVAAYPTGIVGAQFYALDENQKPQTANAWQFPIRTGKHNVSLPLEQAIMHMSTHARRIAILLASIADPARVNLYWAHPRDKPGDTRIAVPSKLADFSIERNVACFVTDTDEEGLSSTAMVALDDIGAVWSQQDGSWAVRIAGWFDAFPADKNGPAHLEYFPHPRRSA